MANELPRSKRIVIDDEYEQQINPENLKLLKKYKRDMEIRELSPKTIYNYERDLMQWFAFLVREQYNPSVLDVNEDDIEEFIYWCKEQGNNTERIKRRMSSIANFYKFLRRKKLIKENPMEFIVRPKKGLPVVVQTFLTADQVDEIRKWLEQNKDLQLTTFFEFGLDTMARVNALTNITWEQIDLDNYVVNDVLEKEGYIVTLYFNDRTKKLLEQLKQEREDNGIKCDYLFISKYNNEYGQVSTSTLDSWIKKIGNAIDVPTLHCHDLRHSGSQLRKLAGMPIETISSLLNHSGLDVTKKHYLREDKTQMSKEMRKYQI
jgi:integrase/recombinase XerC